jgi:SAM-dependent methyltransferase
VRLGATHRDKPLAESISYVERVVGEYERYGGLTREALAGARVLELGPGDNLGVALHLLAKGAARVVCLDRFVTWRDPDQQREINAALVERIPEAQRDGLGEVLDERSAMRPNQGRLELIEGVPIEEAEGALPRKGFEVIISRAVLAHVDDLGAAYDVMDRLLALGGRMAHKVDLSDIGLFTRGGQHPLTFLTVSDPVWNRMRRHVGHSNRRLVDFHVGKLAELGYSVEVKVTRLIGGEEFEALPMAAIGSRLDEAQPLIGEMRPKLLDRYRELSDEELAIAGVFISAQKPGKREEGRA